MKFLRSCRPSRFASLTICFLTSLGIVAASQAQTCYTADDMDPGTKAVLLNTAKRYFDMAAKGDSASLKQNSISSLASDFSGVENAVKDNQTNFSAATPTPRPPFLLKVEGAAPVQRAEFLCGVFGANGQTANSAEFVIPNMPPGTYGIVTLDVPVPKGANTLTLVLQQQGNDWKMGGFYVRGSQVAGHDGDWFAEHARTFKSKGQNHNAWLYYVEARELLVPVPFMYTQKTDRLYDEAQTVKTADLPVEGNTADLVSGGKTYRLTSMFPLAVGQDLDMVVKYQAADVSDSGKTFQENTAVMKALVAKYPELRDAFNGIVARAVEPSGRDYGTMLPMKDIK